MVAAFMNEAVRNNMPVFMKLVQFDVLKAIQEKAVEDKVAGETPMKSNLPKLLIVYLDRSIMIWKPRLLRNLMN